MSEPVGPLRDTVRARVVLLTAEALGTMAPERLPPSLRRVASFAPSRRARLAATQIATMIERDDEFRERVADQVRTRLPELCEALEGGTAPAAVDPVELAAVAYLLRPDRWAETVAAASDSAEDERSTTAALNGSQRLERLHRRLEAVTDELSAVRRRHRDQLDEAKAANADLRRRLGEARVRTRAAEGAAARAAQALEAADAAEAARAAEREAELRRVRARTEALEAELAGLRRAGRAERGAGTMRARLLLDTMLETAQGLRRELALPAVDGSPADAVAAHVAEQGSRASSGEASMASDDPALLDQLLALPRVHLVVDGYNVTKAAWPELSLERQRERLLAGVAPLVARSGAEVTVVFDAADSTERPVVNRPRGVRVLYSPPGVIADDVIRELVAAEPRGRPLVVVSSDQEVARDVARAGARVVASSGLHRLLGRT